MKYFGSWSCKEDVARDFNVDVETLKNANVLMAWYGSGDYCGSAFVLFEKDGQLYEVHGSHCSCYGLEDQWDPEKTSVEALAHVLKDGYMISDGYDYAEEARKALGRVLKRL
jgi:hypothetical protein